jgi:hypothetical protein
MYWTRWILFLLLLAFLIWIFYLWQKQEKIKEDWRTHMPSDYLIQYSPFRLPYRFYVWDTEMSPNECISLCDMNSVKMEDSFYTPKGPETKPLHELVKRVTKKPFSHHEIQIHRIVDGGTEFGYDADPETNTRIGTVVVYLNEGYEGGELTFSEQDTVVPKRGRMVLYWTVDGHTLLKESQHRHRCILNGTQWKAIIYIHSKPFQ